MNIIINDYQDKVKIDKELYKVMKDIVKKVLEIEGKNENYEISITIVDNEYIRELNMERRNIDKETDVLSFPMFDYNDCENYDEYNIDLDNDCIILGDIIISAEKAKEQAKEYEHSFIREMAFLVTHGILHLIGYTHESKEKEINMIRKQEMVLNDLKIYREK